MATAKDTGLPLAKAPTGEHPSLEEQHFSPRPSSLLLRLRPGQEWLRSRGLLLQHAENTGALIAISPVGEAMSPCWERQADGTVGYCTLLH